MLKDNSLLIKIIRKTRNYLYERLYTTTMQLKIIMQFFNEMFVYIQIVRHEFMISYRRITMPREVKNRKVMGRLARKAKCKGI